MEKIKLNNQIVRMRKHVKQAKVHSINRLVKQMKLLHNRKGDETQVKKAVRKAERYRQEISLLKKMKPDDVSKLALSKAKNWKDILSQKNSTLEDRCIAILASYKPVQKEVELFHNSNRDMVLKIPDLFKQWEEKRKFPKDSPHNKNPNFIKLPNKAKLSKTKLTGCTSISDGMTNQLESTDNVNSKSFTEETVSGLLTKNSPDLKTEMGKKVFQMQKMNTSKKTPFNSSLDRNNCDHLEKNGKEIKAFNKTEIELKMLDDGNRKESENYIDSNLDKEAMSCESSEESEIENESDMEKSEDSESIKSEENSSDNELQTERSKVQDTDAKKLIKSKHSEYDNNVAANKKSPDAENVTTCSFTLPKDTATSKPSENKLKAITVINLDDFRDLDEIPVNNYVGNIESSEEEEEDDTLPQNDPFFLGRDEAVSTENKLIDDMIGSSFGSRNEIFEKKEKSNNHNNYEKTHHKPLKNSRFSSNYSTEFKAEKNFKSWNKDTLTQNHHQGRFKQKNKGSFDSEDPRNKYQPKYKNMDRGNFKNKKEFNQKAGLQTQDYKQKYLNSLNHKNSDNFSKNSKEPHKKSETNSKPLHPSWEAKRKQKEMVNASFQGKKIKFED